MNPSKGTDEVRVNFLIATPKGCGAPEAARARPAQAAPPAHDASARLLRRLEPDPATLWREAAGRVERRGGVGVIGDSTPDRPYAQHMELVRRHRPGTRRAVPWSRVST